jgi:hypothetical protein
MLEHEEGRSIRIIRWKKIEEDKNSKDSENKQVPKES